VAVTQKISVAIGRDELRVAKIAARDEGVSLSAYITRAVQRQLQERQRLEAAREFLATFAPEELPTPEEQRELVELWTRARAVASRSSKTQAARRRRAPRA
jgi:hypothetical protein